MNLQVAQQVGGTAAALHRRHVWHAGRCGRAGGGGGGGGGGLGAAGAARLCARLCPAVLTGCAAGSGGSGQWRGAQGRFQLCTSSCTAPRSPCRTSTPPPHPPTQDGLPSTTYLISHECNPPYACPSLSPSVPCFPSLPFPAHKPHLQLARPPPRPAPPTHSAVRVAV